MTLDTDLAELFVRARDYEDKPHLLYSHIAAMAERHAADPSEIRRVMDVAYRAPRPAANTRPFAELVRDFEVSASYYARMADTSWDDDEIDVLRRDRDEARAAVIAAYEALKNPPARPTLDDAAPGESPADRRARAESRRVSEESWGASMVSPASATRPATRLTLTEHFERLVAAEAASADAATALSQIPAGTPGHGAAFVAWRHALFVEADVREAYYCAIDGRAP